MNVMRKNAPENIKEVKKINPTKKVKVGKPSKIPQAAMRSKVAMTTSGMGMSDTRLGVGGNYYSPELSPDFLQLPQSVDEQRNYYRFFYDNDPRIGQAVDLLSELPLSKLRLRRPVAKNREMADRAMRFCNRWIQDTKLLHRLIEIVHSYILFGETFVFVEDATPDMPKDIEHQRVNEVQEDGSIEERWVSYPDAKERVVTWLKQNYKGWTALRVLPPEQIHMESFPLTDQCLFDLVIDSKTKAIVERAVNGDVRASQIVASMPKEIVEHTLTGEPIPLNTDPMAGSFLYYLARKKIPYEPRGKSLLQRCMRVLVHDDKLRQAQTSISSRHMTPYRLVSAENLSEPQLEELREQVDLALQDPDFSIITNYPVTWEERGGGQENRLLELGSEYERVDKQLYAGLGVTESLLSGESSYSGDRINLEVINVRFLLLREILQDMVDNFFFAPMCARMGFIEEDEDGQERVIHPRLSFTRMALRDNQETFDSLFNLYQKGSLDVETILDLLNIDPDTVREKIVRDTFTVNDPIFNELIRGVYGEAGRALAENSNIVNKLAQTLGLDYAKPQEGADRFG